MIAEIEKGAERRGGWDRKSLQALIYKKQESFVCECETKVGKFGLSISHTHTFAHICNKQTHIYTQAHTHTQHKNANLGKYCYHILLHITLLHENARDCNLNRLN